MADLLKVQENIAEAVVIWGAFPLGCQSYFSQEYRIICKKTADLFFCSEQI